MMDVNDKEDTRIQIDDDGHDVFNFDMAGKWTPIYEGGYEKFAITMDSGSIDKAGPPEAAEAFSVEPSEGSKRNLKYNTANGGIVSKEGEQKIT